jgi:hypothetical protein
MRLAFTFKRRTKSKGSIAFTRRKSNELSRASRRKRGAPTKLRSPPHPRGKRTIPPFASGSLMTSSLTLCPRAAFETYVCGQSKRWIVLRPGALSLHKTPPITDVKIRKVFHGRIES